MWIVADIVFGLVVSLCKVADAGFHNGLRMAFFPTVWLESVTFVVDAIDFAYLSHEP